VTAAEISCDSECAREVCCYGIFGRTGAVNDKGPNAVGFEVHRCSLSHPKAENNITFAQGAHDIGVAVGLAVMMRGAIFAFSSGESRVYVVAHLSARDFPVLDFEHNEAGASPEMLGNGNSIGGRNRNLHNEPPCNKVALNIVLPQTDSPLRLPL
jgi:hypothetical protein